MEKKAFKLLHDMERSWWYRGRELVTGRVLGRFIGIDKDNEVIDWGAGYGGMLEVVEKYGSVDAFELDSEARQDCKNRGYRKVFATAEEALSNQRYTMASLFDVLEHVEHDKDLVDQLYKNILPGGHIIITVPAFQWLWSSHDTDHQHYRRYSKKMIMEVLTKAGFKVKYLSYWNMVLFLPAAGMRLLGFSGSNSLESGSLLNKIFYIIIFLESLLVPFVSLPFGTGLVVIAQKK